MDPDVRFSATHDQVLADLHNLIIANGTEWCKAINSAAFGLVESPDPFISAVGRFAMYGMGQATTTLMERVDA